MCFLPQDARAREAAIGQLERFVEIEGQIMLGWRDVPIDTAGMSPTIVADMPVNRQAIVARGPRATDQDASERKLLAIRSEERRVGKGCVSTWRIWGTPDS